VAKIWQSLHPIFLKCSQQTDLHLGNALFEFKAQSEKHKDVKLKARSVHSRYMNRTSLLGYCKAEMK